MCMTSRLITVMQADEHTAASGKPALEAPGRLTVTLGTADRAELERLAHKEDRSLGWMVREAIRQYIAKSRERSSSAGNGGE